MEIWISNLTDNFTAEYFIKQFLVILAIFLTGIIINFVSGFMRDTMISVLCAFPMGLSLYILCGYMILAAGLYISVKKILFIEAAFLCFLLLIRYLAVKGETGAKTGFFPSLQAKKILPVVLILAAMAAVSVSGIISVSLSNDSMYYFNLYPKALVNYGVLRREFNVMLTDVGLGAAVIGTLPHMFGYNEGFGVLTFFNLNFICIFARAAYNCALKTGRGKGFGVKASLTVTLFLLCAMPFIIISKWVMANVYFMEYMFICFYLFSEFSAGETGETILSFADSLKKGRITDVILISVMVTSMSFLRMEGSMMSILFILIISMMVSLPDTELAVILLLPQILLKLLYDIRIFVLMDINAPYTFLTREKAVIELAALVLVFVYILFLRGRWGFLNRHMGGLILFGLVCVNLVLFLLDRTLYINNMTTFIRNLSNRSGWGAFPVTVLSVVLVTSVCRLTDKKPFKLNGADLFVLGYILLTFAVCFARGNELQENIGDSGNRVLLQIVPMTVFALYIHVLDLMTEG